MCASQSTSLHWHSQPTGNPLLDDWLFNQQSLTQRLQALSDNRFSVRPLREHWQTLRPDECAALGCPPGSTGWVREVFLCGDGQPWIYARSVGSRSALEQSGFDLAGIGRRSLGEFLFSDPKFSRGPLEICQLDSSLLQQTLADDSNPLLWARRSCFRHPDLAILVAEAFLPEFWQYATPELSVTS